MSKSLADQLFTPEQVAERLGLHVRTVRRYIREGTLDAVKVGRRYRVSRQAFEAFAGLSPGEADIVHPSTERFSEVSSIVDVQSMSKDEADRLTQTLMASVSGRPEKGQLLRLEAIYNGDRQHLKLIVTGGVAATATLLELANVLIDQRS